MKTNNASLQPFLETALQAADIATEIQQRYQRLGFAVDSKSNASDLVTQADQECEQEIRKVIDTNHPGHAFLGEEGGETGEGTHRWIVDPLDGTVNYAHGFPFYCVSIALEIEGVRSVAVVKDPNRQETFVAVRGEGAYKNGEQIRVSGVAELRGGRAMLSTGFPYDQAEAVRSLVVFQRFLELGLPVRRPGAAALDLCFVACGRLEGFFETKLNAWDCAAGILMIEEAGGKVTNYAGETYRYEDKKIVASNGLVHSAMLATINA